MGSSHISNILLLARRVKYLINYRPQRSWAKVMFLQASVILSTGVVVYDQVHPPTRKRTPPPYTANERPVRILLECILVLGKCMVSKKLMGKKSKGCKRGCPLVIRGGGRSHSWSNFLQLHALFGRKWPNNSFSH